MAAESKISRYEIHSLIDRGGMSSVFLGFDPNVQRKVAVKVLPPEFLFDPTFKERFRREARIIASLEHPAILPIYDFGEDKDQLFFVMPYMEGGSLTDRLKKGPLSVAEVTALLHRLGPALDYAHKKGVVHRDLKPANILFDSLGNAFLADFGIAHLEQAGATLTGESIIGTPAYMSPEQAQALKTVDGRADIYALGVILFEMLTGKTPYHADSGVGLAIKHVTEPVPHLSELDPNVPQEFDEIIQRAMAKAPNDRYASAHDLTRAAEFVANGTPLPQELRQLSDKTKATKVAGPSPSLDTVASIDNLPERNRRLWLLFGGLISLFIICLAGGATAYTLFGNGNVTLPGFLSPPTDTATPSATVIATVTDTATPSVTPTISATATRTSTATPTLTPAATATATVEETSSPKVTATQAPVSPSPTLAATEPATATATRRAATATATSPPPTSPPPTSPPPTSPPPTSPPPTSPPPTSPPPTSPPPTSPPPTSPPPPTPTVPPP